ncbi:hypothetical protein DAPPUDRAFT_104941 [Daphnia pulex]|uniref:Uncharacterized protein n=1 Tax=Daphnia pulex TaxID=6669 RepID=E9GNV8_DAPPU|nr:hypothetical protein DAPPUDRAFT_104941 [Daphnia pulex]|eukprot:EFX78821.1 hypothetical protein DAPPUDRAFT_104941 [Daphnia pulex]
MENLRLLGCLLNGRLLVSSNEGEIRILEHRRSIAELPNLFLPTWFSLAWSGLLNGRQSLSRRHSAGQFNADQRDQSVITAGKSKSNAGRRGQVCYNASRSRIKTLKAWAGLLQRQSKSNQMLEGVGRSATTPVEVESNAEDEAWAGLLQRQSKSNQNAEGVGRSATTPVEVESNVEGVGRSATTPVEVESNAEQRDSETMPVAPARRTR